MRFLDLRTDFAFKKVFGSEGSKGILISFLNAVIDFGNGRRLTDLTIVDPYSIPILKGMKDTFVDVKAVLDDGAKVIIEMQVLVGECEEQQTLDKAAKNYSTQLVKGDDYTLLNPVIALTLTDFVMFDDDRLEHTFRLLEKEQFVEYNGDIELVFYELPKFNLELDQLQDIRDRWLYFIKNAGSLEYVPDNLEAELQHAFTIANEAGLSEEELELQHKKRDWIFIQKSSRARAERIGHEKGRQEGRQEERANVARQMKADGEPLKKIMRYTGLDENQINGIDPD
jgi:predicted transposase/invertase (TIGR01784 family)